MNIYGMLMLALWEVIFPVAAGTIFISVWRPVVKTAVGRLMACWISGQLLLFALFQLLTVPFILKGKSMADLKPFALAEVAGALVLALILALVRRIREKGRVEEKVAPVVDRKSRILWGIFGLLLLVQLVLSIVMAYADGDDAFYIAVASGAVSGRGLFAVSPYTGLSYGTNLRYALAAFPMWIALLSSLSGIPVAMVAHVCFAPEMILLAYGAFGLAGSLFFREKREALPGFLIILEILVLFGDVSSMAPENFLLARSRQGKAALAAFVIPMVLVLLYLLLEWLQEKGRFGFLHWVLLEAVLLTACMCSTLGAALCCLLLACGGLCGAVMMRKIRHLPLLILLCVPSLIYGGLYLVLG